jgi:hypothetical protein
MRKWIAALCVAAAGCGVEAEGPVRTSNGGVHVEKLFEHDGVKVYRFQDGGYWVYYTDARGEATAVHTESRGKGGSRTIHTRVDNTGR